MLLGCTPAAVEPRVARPADAPAPQPVPSDDVATRPAAPTIGLSHAPVISRAARAANAKGLEHHRAGRFEPARERFAAAVEASPDHDLARFNLACALVQLGRIDEAAAEIATLLVRDPVRFVPRLRDDADLAALRDAPAGAALAASATAALAALEASFDGAIGASMYRATALVPYEPPARQGGAREHVTGIYVPSTRRFVPLVHGGAFGLVDVPGRRVVSIDSELCDAPSDGTSRRVRLDVLALGSLAPARRFDIDREAVALTGDDFPYDGLGDCAYARSVEVRGDGRGQIWVELEWVHDGDGNRSRWFVLDDGRATAATTSPPPGAALSIRREGAMIWTPPPAGHVLAAGAYRPPGATADIRLGRAHRKAWWQSLALTPDGRFAFVTSVREQWRDASEEDMVVRHAIARVELASGAVLEWSSGPGSAATAIADDGSIYVDARGAVRRWASADAPLAAAEDVMPGLHLAPFLQGEWCDRCG